jgi:hypothetical protein
MKVCWMWMVVAGLCFELGGRAYGQIAGYPAPRDPDYKKALQVTVEDLMPVARLMASKPSRRMALSPGYGIKEGENVLIVVSSRFDGRVLEAIRRAIVEAGASVDIVRTHARTPATKSGNAGFEELSMGGEGGAIPQSRFAGTRGVKALFDVNVSLGGKGYDLVISGTGGPNPKADYRWEYIPWDTPDKFLYSMSAFPYEIQEKVDQMLWDTIAKARKIHATDPEGTDITWNWDPKFVGMLKEHWPGYDILKQGHISPMPLFMSPVEANANGKIAGAINHAGTFPHLVLTIQNNEIVNVEGGGEFGRRWKEVLDDCKRKGIHYPGFPAPGCGWFEEAAIGTDPWRTRDLAADLRNRYVWERGRSGVIHWGLGVSRNFDYHPELQNWYRQNTGNVARGGGHNHIHTYLTTMDITDANGKTVRVLDKGRLTFFDDPEVRKIAAKYGNPDELLREKWIPPYPGINLPGDYMKDYAADPYSFLHGYQEKLRKEAGWTPEMGD